MILEALYRLARDEGLVEDPDFEVRPVAWLVDVGDGGELLGVRGTHTETSDVLRGKTRTRVVAKALRVPRQPTRTSGDRAFFLVDKPDYALGLVVAGGDTTAPARERARRR
ncbi:MAG TPA: type I-C CRISPR-associated protein Cas8c/Csd1, partial [Gemmatimonadales bacterium]|nr:type I-C CRISPR-associated protein Cas8c/Csd1 [Gemmatimonadales bacterium]